MTLIIIFLALIAYILWCIYRQREDEKIEIHNEKIDAQHEQKRKERFKDYPHLYGKIEGSWLDVFAMQAEDGIPLLKMAFFLMLGPSTKMDWSEGSMKWDTLWVATKELLEHLEKCHEGSIIEHEIAICTYWQIAAEAMGDLIKESPEKTISESGRESAPIRGEKLEVAPYINIEKITSLFPKKDNHPTKEITFFDKNGEFPRESEGSDYIDEKIKALRF